MKLTDEQIDDFIRAWKESFNEDITPGDARIRAMELIPFFQSYTEFVQANPQTPDSPVQDGA